jgi:hypothetical protein
MGVGFATGLKTKKKKFSREGLSKPNLKERYEIKLTTGDNRQKYIQKRLRQIFKLNSPIS